MSVKRLASMGFYMMNRIATIAMFAGMLTLTACINAQPTVESPNSGILAPTLTPTEVTTAVVTPTVSNTFVPQPTWTATTALAPAPTWTPVPTWTPEPTWTPLPTATPEPTVAFTKTPTPIPTATTIFDSELERLIEQRMQEIHQQPSPTPHPCSLAVIEPTDELQLVYTRYLAADPRYNTITPLARDALHRQFLPIAAAYVVEFIANPTRYASFRDYLLREGLAARDADIAAGFQALQDWDLVPSVGESLYNYSQRRASDPCTPARSRVFADDGSMTLLAVGYAISTTNPFLRNQVIDITIRNINAFRFNDTTTPLIFWILEELVE